jgi:hypothetical protein
MAFMNRPLELNDLTLLVRALHRDVSELDARLHAVEDVVRELQGHLLAGVPGIDLRLEALPGA